VTKHDELERRIHRVGTHVAVGAGARACLFDAVAREHAERDRNWQRCGQIRERPRDRVREHLEVRRLAANQTAERDYRVVPSGACERGHRGRQLERPRHLELIDDRAGGQGALKSPLREGPGDLFVPSGPYECHTRFDKPVSHSRRRLPTHGHLAQSSPRMRSRRVAR